LRRDDDADSYRRTFVFSSRVFWLHSGYLVGQKVCEKHDQERGNAMEKRREISRLVNGILLLAALVAGSIIITGIYGWRTGLAACLLTMAS